VKKWLIVLFLLVSFNANSLIIDFRPHWLAPTGEYVLHGKYPCVDYVYNYFGVLRDNIVIATEFLTYSNLAVFRVEVPQDIKPGWRKAFYTTIPGKKVFISKIACGFPMLGKVSILVSSIEIGYDVPDTLKIKPGEVLFFSIIVNTPDFKVVLRTPLNASIQFNNRTK